MGVEYLDMIITAIIGIATGSVLTRVVDRFMERREKQADRRDAKQSDASMRDAAIRAYTLAAHNYMPERARLKESGQWTPQAQIHIRERAILLAETTMTRELYDWVESFFANPQGWKEAVIASAVEEAKPRPVPMKRRAK